MINAPAVTIVLPAFNEEQNLAPCVEALQHTLDALRCSFEIVIVNDGSRDGTGAVADRLAAQRPNVVVVHQSNAGIGGAFRSGAARARGDYTILWPADMLAEPADLAPYVRNFSAADVIVGVREARVGYNPLMRLNAWIYPRLTRLLFDLDVPDVNWIHAYRTELLRRIRLEQRGIPMLVEALVKLRDLGAEFATVTVQMKARAHGQPSASRVSVMWRTLKGLLAFWCVWRSNRPSR